MKQIDFRPLRGYCAQVTSDEDPYDRIGLYFGCIVQSFLSVFAEPTVAGLMRLRHVLCVAISALGGWASAAESLRVVTDDYNYLDSPYYNVIDDNRPGFSVEVLRAVFAAMGQNASIEGFPTNRAWTMVVGGEADAIVSRARSSEVDPICTFADEPTIEVRWIFFVRTADIGKLKFSSFDDLIGHDVAVRKQVAVSPELWKFLREHHNLVETNRLPESLLLLAAGRVDYTLASVGFGMAAVDRLGLSEKIAPLLSGNTFEGGTYLCFAKARVSSSFVEAFSNALKQFKQTEAYQAIYQKYLP